MRGYQETGYGIIFSSKQTNQFFQCRKCDWRSLSFFIEQNMDLQHTHNTNLCKNNVLYPGINIFNALPQFIQNLFNVKIKVLLHYYYSVNECFENK